MQEFDSISVSSYEAEKLSATLTERSAQGWEVVTILSAGSDVVAYLRRDADGATAATTAAVSAPPAQPAAAPTPAASEPVGTGDWAVGTSAGPAAEPAGWGSSPEASPSADTGWGGGSTSSNEGGWGSTSTAADDGWGTAGATTPGDPASSAPAAGGQASTPAVPPGWFTDPSNRYELRYWDGSAWTEHVARGGQQFTDPPVA